MSDHEKKIHKNPIIPNKECYVAFLDILGFKNIINDWKPSKIKDLFEGLFDMGNLLKSCRATALGDSSNKAVDYFNQCHENIFIYLMSDSIVLAIESNDERNLHFLLYTCDYIQKYLFESNHVLLRGGVSSGWFYGNGSIAFGKAFVDACNLEKEHALYPRVIVDKELSHILEENCNDWPYRLLKEKDYWSVDWLIQINCSKEEIEEICDCKIKTCDNVKSKYQWILNRLRK